MSDDSRVNDARRQQARNLERVKKEAAKQERLRDPSTKFRTLVGQESAQNGTLGGDSRFNQRHDMQKQANELARNLNENFEKTQKQRQTVQGNAYEQQQKQGKQKRDFKRQDSSKDTSQSTKQQQDIQEQRVGSVAEQETQQQQQQERDNQSERASGKDLVSSLGAPTAPTISPSEIEESGGAAGDTGIPDRLLKTLVSKILLSAKNSAGPKRIIIILQDKTFDGEVSIEISHQGKGEIGLIIRTNHEKTKQLFRASTRNLADKLKKAKLKIYKLDVI